MQITTSHQPRILAVLGPTNTGKTYLALERMMAHGTGMIGFPLRLLARENYDRVVQIKGPGQVALITGEEKIIPPHARYFMCTVESMPLEREVDFLGIDEIQLCADPERGHIFTDRLLNARGRSETIFMGSETIAPFIRRLVTDVEFEKRPRFSKLTYSGSKKITRLPARTAIVAFSAAEVYSIAELLRRQKGGAAVVLGALSPRTRNAQVALYQSGEVDYIVATDAIGMGLNMDVDHVAFAALSKFDGQRMRPLSPSELAQIAGRAGRYMKEGTFGVSADCPNMENDIVTRLEEHQFDAIKRIYWRNSKLRFTSVAILQKDLTKSPSSKGLTRVHSPEDERTLDFLSQNPDVVRHAKTPKNVKLLWEVCQVPDFSKTHSDSHPSLLGQIYIHLCSHHNKLPHAWVKSHVMRLDRMEGDIDTLTQRLASIRIWTYISQRAYWLEDPEFWQNATRTIENKISDALHDQLTKRFVDRRTTTLMKRLKDRADLLAGVSKSGEVSVEGHYVGHLQGFNFVADEVDNPHAKRAINTAALKALRMEINERVKLFEEEPESAFSLNESGYVLWRDIACARLYKGNDILHPRLETLPFDLLDSPMQIRVQKRLEGWLKSHIAKTLKPLFQLQKIQFSGATRGLVFQLCENMGTLARTGVSSLIQDVEPANRRLLRKQGLVIERHSLYCPQLLKANAVHLRANLWTLFHQPEYCPPWPKPGLVSFESETMTRSRFYEALGYQMIGNFCLRVDMMERIASLAWERTKKPASFINVDFVSLAGCTPKRMSEILIFLGYDIEETSLGFKLSRRKSNRKKKPHMLKNKAKRHRVSLNPDSPFAILKNFK